MLVADTSALVSLAIADGGEPVRLLFREYDVHVPSAVVSELEEIAAYDDLHAEAASRVLDLIEDGQVRELDDVPEYPLDEGETAAIALANDLGASAFLCDEYHELSTVHALLSESRLVTTPKLVEALVLRGVLSSEAATGVLEELVEERSWRGNPYVERFIERFDP